MKKLLLMIVIIAMAFYAWAGGKAEQSQGFSVLVYVTGVTAGSPGYEMMVQGAQDFAQGKSDVTIKVYEAGFNQAEWESQLNDLVSTGSYDVVLSSNPSLPDICDAVSKRFSNVKFIITDADYSGNSSMATYLFNQYEQSLVLGYLAGLVTVSSMEKANTSKTIGFIASQEFPLLNKHMIPGFIDGAHMADPAIKLDYRVIGNWYDATKAGELAASMIASGVDVITSIAGGAAQGIVAVAKQKGAYLVSFNEDAYEQAPSLVLGCCLIGQRELCSTALQKAYEGSLEYGKRTIVGFKEGYISLLDQDPLFISSLPSDIREKVVGLADKLKEGKLEYSLPSLDK